MATFYYDWAIYFAAWAVASALMVYQVYRKYFALPALPPKSSSPKGAVGIDIGGVIIASVSKKLRKASLEDTHMLEAFLDTPPVPGALEGVKRCVEAYGAANVFLVSYAGARMEKKSRQWLLHHNFYEVTGMLERNVVVCRLTRQKAPICEGLGITHFIDDHTRIHRILLPLYRRRLMKELVLLNCHGEVVRPGSKLDGIVRDCESWDTALHYLLPSDGRIPARRPAHR